MSTTKKPPLIRTTDEPMTWRRFWRRYGRMHRRLREHVDDVQRQRHAAIVKESEAEMLRSFELLAEGLAQWMYERGELGGEAA